MQFFTGLEAHSFTRRDADLGASSRVAPDSSLPRSNAEYTKSAQLNALSCCQGLFQAFKHSIDRLFGLRTGKARALDHMVHDFLFNQSDHLASATVFDCTTVYRTDATAFASFVEQGRP